MESRWVIGKKPDGTYVLVELRGRITDCYFWIDTKWDDGKSHRAAGWIIGYSNRPKINSPSLHASRGAAITKMLERLLAEQAHCRRRADEITAELEIVDKLDIESCPK